MPVRVSNAPGTDRPERSETSASESERSFVSARSENASSRSGNRSREDLSPSTPRRDDDNTSDAGSTSSDALEQATPLARKYASPNSLIRPSATKLPKTADSYFAPQIGAASTSPWSPGNRRPPASRSSHGIETRSGPPPALSTQRSYNADLSGRSLPSVDSTTSQQPTQCGANGGIDPASRPERRSYELHTSQVVHKSRMNTQNLKGQVRKQRASKSLDNDDPTLRPGGQGKQGDLQDGKQHQNREDLFLNLARADSLVDDTSDTMSRTERRRSRFGNSASKSSQPSSSGRPTSSGGRLSGHHASPGQPLPSLENSSFDSALPTKSIAELRDEDHADRPYAASAHPLDRRHGARYSGSSSKPPVSSLQYENGNTANAYGRRRSIHAPSQAKHNSSPVQERRGTVHGDEVALMVPQGGGTESTLSTAAPSTVWDELDDLKSRIRKIELTGNLPSTSNAAMSTLYRERPATATTTLTASSTSPKRRQRPSTSSDVLTTEEQTSAHMHPLLTAALAKTKPRMKPSLFRALETSAADALGLVAMTGSKSSRGASANQADPVTIDRQIRRKADSVCRSLTELCIALAEHDIEPESPSRTDLGGLDTAIILSKRTEDPRLSKGVSEDPELRASSRVMSRLEARRTSLLGSGSFGQRSPQEPAQPELPTSTQERPSFLTSLDRTSSVIRRREDDNESPISRRPPSRAATEAGNHRPLAQTRTSREYTSHHPMPSPTNRSPSVQSSLPMRKSYFNSPSALSPHTPNVQPGNRRYLDRTTPPSTDSARLAEARQRRLASLGQHSSPSGAVRAGSSIGRLRHVESEKG